VRGDDDVHRVGNDSEMQIALGKAAQDERKRQRIERTASEARDGQQRQQRWKVRTREGHQEADSGEDARRAEQYAPRSEQSPHIDRERADEHHAHVVGCGDPRGGVGAERERAAQIGDAHAQQAAEESGQ
jgi:hypothetical protein